MRGAVLGMGLCALAFAPAFARGAQPLTASDPSRALPSSPATAPQPLVRPAPRPPAITDPKAAKQLLTLSYVEFSGARTLSPTMLRPAWAPYSGKAVSLADLRKIARRAEAIYAAAGYPFVAVVVPAQEAKKGVVRLKVVEGRISDLTVLGLNPTARRQATEVFSPLVNETPLAAVDVERAYQNAENIPGLVVSGALRRGSEEGGMDLVVQAQRQPFRTYFNVNNLYPSSVGPWGALVGFDYFGASRYGDQTSVQLFSNIDGGEQISGRFSHTRRLNDTGTSISATVLVAKADPKGAEEPLELATNVIAGRLELGQPLIQSPIATLAVDGALELNDQKTDVFSKVGLSKDDLRVMSLGAAWELRLKGQRLAASVEFRQGLNVLGASREGDPLLSRTGADPEGALMRFKLEDEQKVAGGRVMVRVDGQLAGEGLTAPEQYSVGNLTIGRGYEPGAAFGDKAVGVSAEFRLNPFALPRQVKAEPFVFYDGVGLWAAPGAQQLSASNGRWLWSTGGGVRFEAPGPWRVDIVYAMPQKAPLGFGEPKPDPVVLVNITARLDDLFTAVHRKLFPGSS